MNSMTGAEEAVLNSVVGESMILTEDILNGITVGAEEAQHAISTLLSQL